ncbi:MAG: hypothetical protein AAFX06_15585 [Planctomycetota bacterium]
MSRRSGISLLELVIAGSLLATVMASLSLVMRTSRQSWETIDTEYWRLHRMQAVSRHVIRQAREATSVATISPAGTLLTIESPSGTASWEWRSTYGDDANVVLYRAPTGAESVLARDIDSLQFVGYGADGFTAESDASRVHVVQVRVAVTLPRAVATQRSITSKVWLRAW